jgi:polyhydroxyalkanoate synthesis repressor PhaR
LGRRSASGAGHQAIQHRKLYDTRASHYVDLGDLADLVRLGEEFRVVLHGTEQEVTAAALAQIIYEEERTHGPRRPVKALVRIIRSGMPVG